MGSTAGRQIESNTPMESVSVCVRARERNGGGGGDAVNARTEISEACHLHFQNLHTATEARLEEQVKHLGALRLIVVAQQAAAPAT